MSAEDNPTAISPEALADLRQLCEEEYGHTLSDEEIQDIGRRLMTLYEVLTGPEIKPAPEKLPIELTKQESEVLTYLHEAIVHRKVSPSIRDITKALGLRSSRSGFRILNRLIERGLVKRDRKGKLTLRDDLLECKAEDEMDYMIAGFAQ